MKPGNHAHTSPPPLRNNTLLDHFEVALCVHYACVRYGLVYGSRLFACLKVLRSLEVCHAYHRVPVHVSRTSLSEIRFKNSKEVSSFPWHSPAKRMRLVFCGLSFCSLVNDAVIYVIAKTRILIKPRIRA
jgi:hypothetical protein